MMMVKDYMVKYAYTVNVLSEDSDFDRIADICDQIAELPDNPSESL